MLKTMDGLFHNGKIEFSDIHFNIPNNSKVVVTVLEDDSINLNDRGINKSDAVELRSKLASFSCDWDSPEMDIYNNYSKKNV